jgi:ureidoacrylate peracid hydrolase
MTLTPDKLPLPNIDWLDPSDTALLVVDMQNGYLSKDHGLGRAGANIEPQRATIPHVRELVGACREAGIPILWSQQVHMPGDATRKNHRIKTHLDKRGTLLCERGTEDVEFPAPIAEVVHPDDHVFEKHRSSCFFDTVLYTKLRALGIRTLVVCGVSSNYCIDATIRDAYFRDYDVIVIEDTVAGSYDDLHAAFLKNFQLYFGLLLPMETFTAQLERVKS